MGNEPHNQNPDAPGVLAGMGAAGLMAEANATGYPVDKPSREISPFEISHPPAEPEGAVLRQRLVVSAETTEAGEPRRFIVRGQTAKALLALVKAGRDGRTAQEVAAWAYRFAAYCFTLIHTHGLAIRCDRESHRGGWHGRHVLETPVRIVAIDGGDGAPW
jgi:hypothetical protein